MSLPVIIQIKQVVVLGSTAGGRIADVGMPAKEASPELPGFAGQPPPRGESPRWFYDILWSEGPLWLTPPRGFPSRHTPLAALLPDWP